MAIYLKINKEERIQIKPTIFPDKTSQVWKVPGIDNLNENDKIYIYWVFEEEAELIWLFQLIYLIDDKKIDYIIPYLPYARQDKYDKSLCKVSNSECFASYMFQQVFDWILRSKNKIYLLDAHSKESYSILVLSCEVINCIPYSYIGDAFNNSKSDIMLMPDEGAFRRYVRVDSFVATHCIKKRNQATGKIESISLPDVDFKDKRVFIVDDICDGGATFIEIARQLNEVGAAHIALWVTHGIFSKGIEILHDAGIRQIYHYNYDNFYLDVIDE